jgi:hypothetical protein
MLSFLGWMLWGGFAAVIADEIAFWRTDEGAATPDVEVLNAVRPGLANIPGSPLICVSSPYARRGALWCAHREHYGKDGDPVLVVQGSTLDFNPTIDPRIIDAAYAADPVAAAAEWGGQFRTDVESFLTRDQLERLVVAGRVELLPAGFPYVAFLDPSGGAGDSFTLAIAHREDRDGRIVMVLDRVDETRPPFSADEVVARYAATLKAYAISSAQADRYAGTWVTEAFARHGISVKQSAAPKSEIYASFLPLVTSGRVELLDHPRLLTQLLSLERRTGRGGRDSIDHAPGARDDVANAVAGSVAQAARSLAAGPMVYLVRT